MAVAFSRLLDRRLTQPFNPHDLDTRDTRPDLSPPVRSGSNARHHPPPHKVDLHESHRVGGRVHAVVMRLSGFTIDPCAFRYLARAEPLQLISDVIAA